MRMLLDSHVFLWVLERSNRLSDRARAALRDPGNQKHISFASLWEITIKVSLGRLDLPMPWETTLRRLQRRAPGFILPLEPLHLLTLRTLPLLHKDPFDRLLVAQALSEGMTFVSADETLDAYGVRRLW